MQQTFQHHQTIFNSLVYKNACKTSVQCWYGCIPILLGSKYGHFTNITTTILTFTAIIKSIQRFTIPTVTYKMKALLKRGLNIGCPIQIVVKHYVVMTSTNLISITRSGYYNIQKQTMCLWVNRSMWEKRLTTTSRSCVWINIYSPARFDNNRLIRNELMVESWYEFFNLRTSPLQKQYIMDTKAPWK